MKKLVSLEIPVEDPYMTPDQVCGWLQIEKDWLYDMVQKRAVPHVKLGRQLRFQKSAMEAWIAGQTR